MNEEIRARRLVRDWQPELRDTNIEKIIDDFLFYFSQRNSIVLPPYNSKITPEKLLSYMRNRCTNYGDFLREHIGENWKNWEKDAVASKNRIAPLARDKINIYLRDQFPRLENTLKPMWEEWRIRHAEGQEEKEREDVGNVGAKLGDVMSLPLSFVPEKAKEEKPVPAPENGIGRVWYAEVEIPAFPDWEAPIIEGSTVEQAAKRVEEAIRKDFGALPSFARPATIRYSVSFIAEEEGEIKL